MAPAAEQAECQTLDQLCQGVLTERAVYDTVRRAVEATPPSSPTPTDSPTASPSVTSSTETPLPTGTPEPTTPTGEPQTDGPELDNFDSAVPGY